MGKGLEGGLHTAALPPIPVALVRPGIEVWTHHHLPVWKFRVGSDPYAFNVVSRTLATITVHTIEGAGVWYVDDLNACSNRRAVDSDMSRVDVEVRTLLGPGSVAAEKDKTGR